MGIENFNIKIGEFPLGKKNLITDVEGIKIGHTTLDDGKIKTGVTALIPHSGNIFREKLLCTSHVINGFGKSCGLMQIDELGTLETPIVLTNTLSVGTAYTAVIRHMLENDDIGTTTGTVNPVVCECNDGFLNDIRGLHVKEEHIFQAISRADVNFLEGNVGAGTGMSCYQLKGGIGSASRIITFDGEEYTIGALVLSNFGLKKDLMINGKKIGEKILSLENEELLEKGSIIIILATDIPLSERQLKRISKRVPVALARTGSHIGNGSGDVVIAFTTGNKINHYEEKDIVNIKMINENKIDTIFRAAIETVEESIISSLLHSTETTGRDGHTRESLKKYIDFILK